MNQFIASKMAARNIATLNKSHRNGNVNRNCHSVCECVNAFDGDCAWVRVLCSKEKFGSFVFFFFWTSVESFSFPFDVHLVV